MTHFVCEACGGVAHEAGVCQTEGCSLKGQALKECNCEDGMHGKQQDAAAPQPQA